MAMNITGRRVFRGCALTALIALVATVLSISPALGQAETAADGAASDDNAFSESGEAVEIDVVANDDGMDDFDADPSLIIVDQPDGGFLSTTFDVDGIAMLLFSANVDFNGVTTGKYRSCWAEFCDNADVTIYVGGEACTIAGTSGPDILTGTPGDDVICGLSGQDTIDGNGGDDLIFGGNGKDTLRGAGGADEIYGGRGDDTIFGGNGDDRLFGRKGADTISGNGGADEIHGNRGRDVISGGNGDDMLFGGRGRDAITGGDGGDVIRGRRGDDDLRGNASADQIFGGRGDDSIRGNGGDDVLNGGRGTDTVNGGNDQDICTRGETVMNCENDPVEPGDDNDGDGIPDDQDPDDDNDGTPDDQDAFPLDPTETTDTDGDGVGDNTDPDIDGDGVSNNEDAFPLDPAETIDTDGDGTGNNADTDDDDDGILDADDPTPLTPGPFDSPDEEVAVVTPTGDEIPFTFSVRSGDGQAELAIGSAGNLYPFDIKIVDPAEAPPIGSPLVSAVFDLRQDPLSPAFSSAELTIAYDEALLAGDLESDVRIYTFDEVGASWVLASSEQILDVEQNTVTATLDHFSCYAALSRAPGPETGDCIVDANISFGAGFAQTSPALLPNVLIQPTTYGPSPAIDQRYYVRRDPFSSSDNPRLEISSASYEQVVGYDPATGRIVPELCAAPACGDLLAAGVFDLGRNGAFVIEGVESQAIFEDQDSQTLLQRFIQEQLAIRCFLDSQVDELLGSMPLSECFALITDSGNSVADFEYGRNFLEPFFAVFSEADSGKFQYKEWLATDLPLLFDEFDLTTIRSGAAIRYRSTVEGTLFRSYDVTPESLADARDISDLSLQVTSNWSAISDRIGGSFTFEELLTMSRVGLTTELAVALSQVDGNIDRYRDRNYRWMRDLEIDRAVEDLTLDHFQANVIRLGALDNSIEANELLTSLVRVTDGPTGLRPFAEPGVTGIDLRRFTGFEPQIREMFELALEETGENDRVAHHDLISRLPETYEGVRNELITGYYHELANTIQIWADGAARGSAEADARPVAWGSVAQWASLGIQAPIQENLRLDQDIFLWFGEGLSLVDGHTIRQAAGDGNQWIFTDALRHYARLANFVETNPNPTVTEWEAYFHESNWEEFDRVAREAMLALVASRYASEPAAQQALMLVHTANFGDVEQQGAQHFLELLDDSVDGQWDAVPNRFVAAYVNVQMGSSFINVDLPLQDAFTFVDGESLEQNSLELGFAGPLFETVKGQVEGQQNHDPEFWNSQIVCRSAGPLDLPSDPGEPGEDCFEWPRLSVEQRGEFLSRSTLQVVFDADTTREGTLDLRQIETYPSEGHDYYTRFWSDWRLAARVAAGQYLSADNDVYSATRNGSWSTFDRRMWFLMNLFRANLMDPAVKDPARTKNDEPSTFRADVNNHGAIRGELREKYSSATMQKLVATRFDTSAPPIEFFEPSSTLQVDAAIDPESVRPGGSAVFEINVQSGSQNQDDVRVGVSFPIGDLTPTTVPDGCIQSTFAPTYECSLGNLSAGDSATVEFQISVSDTFPASAEILYGGSLGQALFDQSLEVPRTTGPAVSAEVLGANSDGSAIVPGEAYVLFFEVDNRVRRGEPVRFSMELPEGIAVTDRSRNCAGSNTTRLWFCTGDSSSNFSVFDLDQENFVFFNITANDGYVPGTILYGIGDPLTDAELIRTQEFEMPILTIPNTSAEEFSVTVTPPDDLTSPLYDVLGADARFRTSPGRVAHVEIQAGPTDVEGVVRLSDSIEPDNANFDTSRATFATACQSSFDTCGFSLRAGESTDFYVLLSSSNGVSSFSLDLDPPEVVDFNVSVEVGAEVVAAETITLNYFPFESDGFILGARGLNNQGRAFSGARFNFGAGITWSGTSEDLQVIEDAGGASVRYLLPEGMSADTALAGFNSLCTLRAPNDYLCDGDFTNRAVRSQLLVDVSESFESGDISWGLAENGVPALTETYQYTSPGDGRRFRSLRNAATQWFS